MSGHPDDQAYAQWRQDPQVEFNTNITQGDHFYGPFTISHYAGILLNVILQNNQLVVNLEFSNDPGFATTLETYTWFVTTVTQLLVTVPATANYWRLHLFAAVAGNTGVEATATPTNIGAQDVNYPVVGNNVIKGSTSCPASSFIEYPLPYIQAGQCTFMMNDDDGTGHLVGYVYQQNATGGIAQYVFRTATGTVLGQAQPFLPDSPCALVIQNQDAGAAHNFHAALVPGGPT